MEVTIYIVVNKDGSDAAGIGWRTYDYEEAKKVAMECKAIVKCLEFEFSDSYVVDDFTEPDDETGS